MKLIPLEEVEKMIMNADMGGLARASIFAEKTNLKTIDPIAIIDDMIEDNQETLRKGTMSNIEFTDLIAQKYILEKLKSRLLNNK